MRLLSNDHDGAASPSPRKARGVPPVNGMRILGPPASFEILTQISAPSPENPKVLRRPDALSGPMPSVRLRKFPVPTCFSQMSNSPAASDMNATNFPSGEISPDSSAPSQSVNREKCAAASGDSIVNR